ncbi:MAG TPA: hypothetical protein PKI19_11210 [Elusimicrobiales bacterium]|nr:hypothetical protein [Elusimicrobiales bacterium]
MLTKGAIEDLIAAHLSRDRSGKAASSPRKVPELKKKIFLSDFELRKKLAPGARSLSVPANAIISPLALDWLEYNGIEIIRLRG